MNLGAFIQMMRKKHNFSQEYLARELGISRPTYIQIEKGEREVTLSEAEKLAAIFGISLNDLRTAIQTSPKINVAIEAFAKTVRKNPEIRISVPQRKLDKFKEILLYILEKVGAKPNVGETVIYKLLYFIDFDYYEKFEEQLIGATYIKNYHGPTPVEFAKIIDQMEADGEIERVRSKYFQYDQKKYLPHRQPDFKKINLSATEITHIDEVLTRIADKNANELSQLSHNDVPWIVAENGGVIDYEAVFYRTPETSVRNYDDEAEL